MIWGVITSEAVGVIKMLEGSVNETVWKDILTGGRGVFRVHGR